MESDISVDLPVTDKNGPDSASPSPSSQHIQPKRTRATKACDTCRKKRTKCSGDYPCAGCKAFGFVCSYSDTTKRRGPMRKNTIKTLENRLKIMESLLSNPGDSPTNDLDDMDAAMHSNWEDGSPTDQGDIHGPSTKSRSRRTENRDARRHQIVMDASGSFVMYYGKSTIVVNQPSRYQDGLLTLPFSIPPQTSNLSPTHQSNRLPFSRDQMIRLSTTYFYEIHPYLPIVDRASFFRTLAESPEQYMPAPFRALLLAIVVVVLHHMPHPEQIGLTGASVDEIYEKAREIVANYEAPHVWIIQAFLLLSLCGQGRGNGFINRWRLTAIAVRSAQELGLHRNLQDVRRPVHINDPTGTEETRRRTWHGAYILERYSSMATGRPLMIQDDDWDIPFPSASEIQEDIDDANFLRFQSELCAIMGAFLNRSNSARGAWKRGKVEKAEGGREIVEELQARLETWREALPSSLRLAKNGVGAGGGPTGRQWSRREGLHGTYHTIILQMRRALLGRYDAECRRSAAALVEILETLRNFSSSLGGPFSATSHPPPPPLPSVYFHFVNVPLCVVTAWDAIFCEVLAGDECSMEKLERIHVIVEELAPYHRPMTVHLGLMADILESKGIKSRLRAWMMRVRARMGIPVDDSLVGGPSGDPKESREGPCPGSGYMPMQLPPPCPPRDLHSQGMAYQVPPQIDTRGYPMAQPVGHPIGIGHPGQPHPIIPSGNMGLPGGQQYPQDRFLAAMFGESPDSVLWDMVGIY